MGAEAVNPDADGMLYLLKANPTLLPEAPPDADGKAIEHRRHDEVHPCLRCGKRAMVAYIAALEIGPRWVDLCPGCALWLQSNPV